MELTTLSAMDKGFLRAGSEISSPARQPLPVCSVTNARLQSWYLLVMVVMVVVVGEFYKKLSMRLDDVVLLFCAACISVALVFGIFLLC